MRKLTLLSTVLGLLLTGNLQADGDPDLVRIMADMQRHLHKLSLSLDHDNQPLAAFYHHELVEALEAAEAVESYDGHPVGQLSRTMLQPAVERLKKALDSGVGTDEALDGVIRACNACHQVTEHGFLRIQRSEDNPFMQLFEPPETQEADE